MGRSVNHNDNWDQQELGDLFMGVSLQPDKKQVAVSRLKTPNLRSWLYKYW